MSRKDIVFDPRLFCYDDPATPGMRKIDAVKDYSTGKEETMIINPVKVENEPELVVSSTNQWTNEYTIKDSGQRQQFSSGMVRDTEEGKCSYDLIYSGPMMDRWAEHLTKGAKKYNDNNWMLAHGEAELKRFRKSAARHFRQWMRGDKDEDHAAAVYFNINGFEYVKEKLG